MSKAPRVFGRSLAVAAQPFRATDRRRGKRAKTVGANRPAWCSEAKVACAGYLLVYRPIFSIGNSNGLYARLPGTPAASVPSLVFNEEERVGDRPHGVLEPADSAARQHAWHQGEVWS